MVELLASQPGRDPSIAAVRFKLPLDGLDEFGRMPVVLTPIDVDSRKILTEAAGGYGHAPIASRTSLVLSRIPVLGCLRKSLGQFRSGLLTTDRKMKSQRPR